MYSPSNSNEILPDEFHKEEDEHAYRVRVLECSILTLSVIIACIFIYCVHRYRGLSMRIHARVAEGGLDYIAACLVPLLVWFWVAVGSIMEVGRGIGFVCKGVKGWLRPNRPGPATATATRGGGGLLRVLGIEDILNLLPMYLPDH